MLVCATFLYAIFVWRIIDKLLIRQPKSFETSNNPKAYFRRAQAFRALDNFAEAAADLKLAIEISPDDITLRRELIALNKQKQLYHRQEAMVAQKAFARCSSLNVTGPLHSSSSSDEATINDSEGSILIRSGEEPAFGRLADTLSDERKSTSGANVPSSSDRSEIVGNANECAFSPPRNFVAQQCNVPTEWNVLLDVDAGLEPISNTFIDSLLINCIDSTVI